MAQAACVGKQDSIRLVEGGELHPGNQHRRNHTPANRRSKRKAEPERIRALYAEKRNGYEVARLLKLGHTTVYKHLRLSNPPKPRWTEEENQVMVDGYAEKRSVRAIAGQVGRSPRAVMVHMCRYRKHVRGDPKKRRALSMITLALKAVRKADIFREIGP